MDTGESTRQYSEGVIIGRFMPPHNGHRFLIDFACSLAERVTIFLCSLPDEPIPGELRYSWLTELYPRCRIVHFTQAIPAAGRDNPNAHRIWADHIRPHMPNGTDAVFASEPYGKPLAAALNADFVPVDIGRGSVPVSGQQIRSNPLAQWQHLPVPVRAYYVKTIALHCRTAAQEQLVYQTAQLLNTVAITLSPTARLAQALVYASRRQANRVLLIVVPDAAPQPQLPPFPVDASIDVAPSEGDSSQLRTRIESYLLA